VSDLPRFCGLGEGLGDVVSLVSLEGTRARIESCRNVTEWLTREQGLLDRLAASVVADGAGAGHTSC
jgi:hypothetical protein